MEFLTCFECWRFHDTVKQKWKFEISFEFLSNRKKLSSDECWCKEDSSRCFAMKCIDKCEWKVGIIVPIDGDNVEFENEDLRVTSFWYGS